MAKSHGCRLVGVWIVLAGVGLAMQGQSGPGQAKTPVEWFRRADALTNLRMPGAGPFHMNVRFHAYPAIDLAAAATESAGSRLEKGLVSGHPFVISGEGSYEEWWSSPEQWRCEATFGSYHAVEVRNRGVRTMTTSEDYEPVRLLMLIEALEDPVPRWVVEPELMKHPPAWKLEDLRGGSAPWVRISYRFTWGHGPLESLLYAFGFEPNGVLVRSEINDLTTTWENDLSFGGRVVPQHLSVEAMGHDLLTADVAIEPLGDAGASLFEASGRPADPSMTLRPIAPFNIRHQAEGMRGSMPRWPDALGHPGAGIRLRVTLDRRGVVREEEVIATWPEASPGHSVPSWLQEAARQVLTAVQGERDHPATLDGSPCEVSRFALLVSSDPSDAVLDQP